MCKTNPTRLSEIVPYRSDWLRVCANVQNEPNVEASDRSANL